MRNIFRGRNAGQSSRFHRDLEHVSTWIRSILKNGFESLSIMYRYCWYLRFQLVI